MADPDPSLGDQVVADSGPCIGCGICCDGTIFNNLVLTDEESERMQSLGHHVETEGDRKLLNLGCSYFARGCCSIYENRFAVCRKYQCALLRRYHAGEVSLEEARSTVEEAKQLIGNAEAANPGCTSRAKRPETRRMLGLAMEEASGEERLVFARRLLSLVALERFLVLRFYVPKKKSTEPGDAAPSTSPHAP